MKYQEGININKIVQRPEQSILLIEHTCEEFIISRLKLGVFLINKGFDVFALIPEGGLIAQYNHIQASGIKLLTYPYERNDTNMLSNIRRGVFFKKVFQKHQFDVIHSFKFQPNFYTCLAGLFIKKTKIVLHITGLGTVYTKKESFKFRFLKIISQFIFLFNFYAADCIIFQNPDDKKELWFPKFLNKKYRIIEGSGVDIEKFDKEKYDVAKILQKLGLSNKQFIISFIGRLVWQKGIKELLESVETISKSFPNLHTLIIGERDSKNSESVPESFLLKYSANKNITFLGQRKDIAELLSISGLYVFPSYREGLPRTVLEALATGIPVITTNVPGCNLCVVDAENGYLFESMCTNSLSYTLRKALSSSNLLEMGKKSRSLALAKFQNKIIYQKILKAYPL